VGAREGYFEQAGDGTLFLDEIGDLSLFTQVKLLRVLQQMEFSRLGSTKLVPLKARLIFATHRDLAQLVAEGKFRQDLFYRINVMRIESPALQEHPEDIPQIAEHFLRHYSHVFQKPMENISSDAINMLQSYAWPGNVRELENVIERLTVLAVGDEIALSDLPEFLRRERPGSEALQLELPPQGISLEAVEKELILKALQRFEGNQTKAAAFLDISRRTLIYRMEKHGIHREPGEAVEAAEV
jgi:DNA-binding NtrC family response regulator